MLYAVHVYISVYSGFVKIACSILCLFICYHCFETDSSLSVSFGLVLLLILIQLQLGWCIINFCCVGLTHVVILFFRVCRNQKIGVYRLINLSNVWT